MSIPSSKPPYKPSNRTIEEETKQKSLAEKVAHGTLNGTVAGLKLSLWGACALVGKIGSAANYMANWLYPDSVPEPLSNKSVVQKTHSEIKGEFIPVVTAKAVSGKEGNVSKSPRTAGANEAEKALEEKVELQQCAPPAIEKTEVFREINEEISSIVKEYSIPQPKTPFFSQSMALAGGIPPPPPPPMEDMAEASTTSTSSSPSPLIEESHLFSPPPPPPPMEGMEESSASTSSIPAGVSLPAPPLMEGVVDASSAEAAKKKVSADERIAKRFGISLEELAARRAQLFQVYDEITEFIKTRRGELAEIGKHHRGTIDKTIALEGKRQTGLESLETAKKSLHEVKENIVGLNEVFLEYMEKKEDKLIKFVKETTEGKEMQKAPISRVLKENWIEDYQKEAKSIEGDVEIIIKTINKDSVALQSAWSYVLFMPDEKQSASSERKKSITIAEFFQRQSELQDLQERKDEVRKLLTQYGIRPPKEEAQAALKQASPDELKAKVKGALKEKIGVLQKKNVTSFKVIVDPPVEQSE
jgi:hypothetical protein